MRSSRGDSGSTLPLYPSAAANVVPFYGLPLGFLGVLGPLPQRLLECSADDVGALIGSRSDGRFWGTRTPVQHGSGRFVSNRFREHAHALLPRGSLRRGARLSYQRTQPSRLSPSGGFAGHQSQSRHGRLRCSTCRGSISTDLPMGINLQFLRFGAILSWVTEFDFFASWCEVTA